MGKIERPGYDEQTEKRYTQEDLLHAEEEFIVAESGIAGINFNAEPFDAQGASAARDNWREKSNEFWKILHELHPELK